MGWGGKPKINLGISPDFPRFSYESDKKITQKTPGKWKSGKRGRNSALFASTIGGGIGSENLKIAPGGPSLNRGEESHARGGTGGPLSRWHALPMRLNFLRARVASFRAGARGRAGVRHEWRATKFTGCTGHLGWGKKQKNPACVRVLQRFPRPGAATRFAAFGFVTLPGNRGIAERGVCEALVGKIALSGFPTSTYKACAGFPLQRARPAQS